MYPQQPQQPYQYPQPYMPPQYPAVNAMAAGGVPQAWSQTPMPEAPKPSELEQQLQGWLDQHGVDLSKFGGNVGSLLDGLYEGAQRGFELEDQQKQAPAPAAVPETEQVNWQDWKQYLTLNDRGEYEPSANAPYAVPFAAVRQANEVRRKLERLGSDPDGFLRDSVSSIVEQKAAEIAEQKLRAWQQQQAEENNLQKFVERHSNWMFNDGDKSKGMTEYGNRFVETVQAAEQAGVAPDKVLDLAWGNFQGVVLKEVIESQRAGQSRQSGLDQQGLYDPSLDQNQPRNPDGTFAPKQEQQPQQPMAQQPQAPQQPMPQQAQWQPPEFKYNPAAMQHGFNVPPAQQGYGQAPQYTGPVSAPPAGQAQQPQGAAMQYPQATPPQQSFLEENGVGAALEPSTRSDANAHNTWGSEGGEDFPELGDIMSELAGRSGIDMSVN